jgi:hypothetical protein
MQTITQKKKLSKGTWALIIIGLAALITVIVLAVVGIVPTGFLLNNYDSTTGTAGLLVSYAMFGTTTWINAAIIIALPFVTGIVLAFTLTRYFIGQKVTIATGAGMYTPQTGATPSTNSGTSTEIG